MQTAIDLKSMAKQKGPFGSPGHDSLDVDARALAGELRDRIRGEVRFDDGSRALYSTDGSNYRQVPIGVVVPRDTDDVIRTIEAARRFGAPILARGGGTSLAGQCCNVAVVMDFSKYLNKILEIDPHQKRARIQPGLILDDLRDAAEKHHLTFGPDPSTHNHCTLGGMIGNNSCGVHSVMAGKTDENVEELEIVTYDGHRMRIGKTSDDELETIVRAGGRRGEIYSKLKALRDRYADLIREKFPDIPRRVSGYNLPYLLPEHGFDVAKALVGSECTCVTILEATVRLVYSPPVRSLLVLGYPDVYTAGDHIPEVLAHKPIGLEGLDDRLVDDMIKKKLHPEDVQILPDGGGWLLVEFGGESKSESDGRARELMAELQGKANAPHMKLFDDPCEERMVWLVRESGLGATARVPGEPDTWEGWEDSAVPPENVGPYLRSLRSLFEKFGYDCALYGHFGQGCIHTRIDFDLKTADGIKTFRSFLDAAADLVISYGGSLSGEHGDGQSRAALLPKMFGDEMIRVFEEFKAIWDPNGMMNPRKIVRPYQPDENLRYGAHYNPRQVETHFHFTDDRNSFSYATERCVGVGECRRLSGGTMCPSFRATREEKHSTRGRARLLFEMLQGDPLKGGWRDEGVKEALDLCLSCKGCKGDCPMNVDMATYKAEFLSHYYEGRMRPASAYAMGLIYWWARIASLVPQVANFLTHAPVLGTLAKRMIGIAPERTMPAFAPQTFRAWFRRRAVRNAGRPRVILWPDTFNNHYFPEVPQAAVEVIEAAGFQVIIPEASLCCGRPLYDYGFLGLARSLLRRILDELKPEIEAGTPVVGLEPSCVAVFREEMLQLFPTDEDAIRLSGQTYVLSEFLEKRAPDFQPPRLARKALVHGHCHQKALIRADGEASVIGKLGLEYQIPDTGCCGMAGSFGFEQGDHYEISMKVGEQVLLPAVRSADKETLIIADGFSCREQISQTTDRRALHLAQVLRMALHDEGGASSAYPEKEWFGAPARVKAASGLRTAAILGAGAAIVAAAILWRGRSRGEPSA